MPTERKLTEVRYVYRGLHSGHPEIANGREGRIYPDKFDGEITPAQHNAGGVSGDSPYTSWSFDLAVAERAATDRKGPGIVLRLPFRAPGSKDDWRWVDSPNL